MFEGFANVWTILGLARDVVRDRLLPLTVAGERIVLFRDGAGRLCALLDRCPHRGAALSLGRLCEGVVECPFHGWRFDGSGRNLLVPWNPDARHERLGATALPVRETAGLVWLYTGFEPQGEPEPSATLLRPDVRLCAQSVLWQAHWSRVMENMLDSPHLPFVHRRTIGRGLAPLVGGRMEVDWEPRDYGADVSSEVTGRPRTAGLVYRFPNAMELIIDPPGRILRLMAVCVPGSPGTTRLTLLTLRSFARAAFLDPLFRRMNARIAAEDRGIIESIRPAEVPPAREELSVRTDKPTLAFRKLYFSRLKDSSAAPPRPAPTPTPTLPETG